MKRRNQIILVATFLPVCWLGMMIVHEAGHVLGAWVTGGKVERVVLHPLRFSRTDVAPNPYPAIVAWSGPIFGAAAPVLVFGALKLVRVRIDGLLRFFAGFCLVANGAYVGAGSLYSVGDAADLLRSGMARWYLWLLAGVTVAAGLVLWNGTGPAFGLGPARGAVSPRATMALALLLALIVVAELLLFAAE